MKIQCLSPIVRPDSRILILGSIPGETSLRLKQYYGNKNNQFWRILATLLNIKTPTEYRDKKAMLYSARIALWDVLKNCNRDGSSDVSIECASPNDMVQFLEKNKTIRYILLNGRAAEKYFKDRIGKSVKIPYRYVPSSSSAHAGLTLYKKIALWKTAFEKLDSYFP